MLDEVQWADDDERGSAWTRLLLAGEYRHILLLGALDAEPLVRHAFPDVEVKVFERKLPLEWIGEVSHAFAASRHGARRVQPQGGARARRRGQPAATRAGRRCSTARCRSRRGARRSTASSTARRMSASPPTCSVTASTSPARRCCSPRRRSSTARSGASCCRGSSRRSPGRAGRFGLVERGHVGVLAGVAWANADPGLVESALEPHVELPGRPSRLPDRRRGPDPAAAGRPRRRGPARSRRRARRLASRGNARVGARELARGRVARRRSAGGSPPCRSG